VPKDPTPTPNEVQRPNRQVKSSSGWTLVKVTVIAIFSIVALFFVVCCGLPFGSAIVDEHMRNRRDRLAAEQRDAERQARCEALVSTYESLTTDWESDPKNAVDALADFGMCLAFSDEHRAFIAEAAVAHAKSSDSYAEKDIYIDKALALDPTHQDALDAQFEYKLAQAVLARDQGDEFMARSEYAEAQQAYESCRDLVVVRSQNEESVTLHQTCRDNADEAQGESLLREAKSLKSDGDRQYREGSLEAAKASYSSAADKASTADSLGIRGASSTATSATRQADKVDRKLRREAEKEAKRGKERALCINQQFDCNDRCGDFGSSQCFLDCITDFNLCLRTCPDCWETVTGDNRKYIDFNL